MDPPVLPLDSVPSGNAPTDKPMIQLYLYIARTTPNSVRAEKNLSATLTQLPDHAAHITLEIVDVFTQPRRALNDGIVVTPTFVAISASRRCVLIGDLSDRTHLQSFIEDLVSEGQQ